MLLSNGVALGRNPQRYLGAASANVVRRSNWGTNGAIRNIWAGQATVISGNSIADTAAYPNGYEPPGSWAMAPKGGGFSCYNNILGTGTLTITSLSMGLAHEASLSGSGTISSASLSLIIQLAASLTGSGTISAATLQAIASMLASLSGAGTISAANMSLIVSLIASLSGSGTTTGTLRGTGNMSADIVVTGDVLSTANVGAAVWQEALEAGFTADLLLRIIAAAVAGKVSGGPGSPVFRNVGDTQNLITGTADSSGNRSAATYGS